MDLRWATRETEHKVKANKQINLKIYINKSSACDTSLVIKPRKY